MLVKINEELEVNPEDVSYLLLSSDGVSTQFGMRWGGILSVDMPISEVKSLLYPPKPMTPKELAIYIAKRKNK